MVPVHDFKCQLNAAVPARRVKLQFFQKQSVREIKIFNVSVCGRFRRAHRFSSTDSFPEKKMNEKKGRKVPGQDEEIRSFSSAFETHNFQT